jgi:hypothetical protein
MRKIYHALFDEVEDSEDRRWGRTKAKDAAKQAFRGSQCDIPPSVKQWMRDASLSELGNCWEKWQDEFGEMAHLRGVDASWKPEIESRSYHPHYEWRRKSRRGQSEPQCSRTIQKKDAVKFRTPRKPKHIKVFKAPLFLIEYLSQDVSVADVAWSVHGLGFGLIRLGVVDGTMDRVFQSLREHGCWVYRSPKVVVIVKINKNSGDTVGNSKI